MTRWCWECPNCEDEFWVDWVPRCLVCGQPKPDDEEDET